MEKEKETKPDEETVISKKKENFIFSLIVMAIIALSAGSVFWLWQELKPPRQEKKISIQNLSQDVGSSQDASLESENKAKEEEVAAKETEAVKPEKIDIKVLNGGAAVGTATQVKNALIAGGYVKIEAVNAKATGYKAVTIYYKQEYSDQIQGIKDILKSSYGIIETKEGMNEKEINGDIVIILGK